MQADAAIDVADVFSHLVEFVGAFMAAGAIGFRYAVLRGRTTGDPVYRAASRRGAVTGVVGALLGAWHVAEVLPRFAARQKVSVLEVPLTNLPMGIWVAATALAIIGFLLAALGKGAGWHLAAVGVVAGSLRNLVTGELERVITPTHVLVGGLWIGTLLVLLAAGLPAVFRHADRERRGAIVAEMVNAFSPLALTTGILVVLLGLVLAFREVGSVDALLGSA
ncbi:MAG TPA: hypothetical protein VFQ39_17540, partial [Longimicrobium sp.]|nr:hypothetical protein [Longimicrobium sp.]